jgi:hypothetical protein
LNESTLYNLPPVSARGSFVLAALGLLCLGVGAFAGSALLLPAGIAGLAGLLAGLARFVRVWRGRAYPREGKVTLLAATFVNGSLALFAAIAGYIVLRFGA